MRINFVSHKFSSLCQSAPLIFYNNVVHFRELAQKKRSTRSLKLCQCVESHGTDFTFKKKLVRHLNIIFAPWGREFECANYQKFLSLGGRGCPWVCGMLKFSMHVILLLLKKQIIPVFHTGEGKGNGTRKPNRYRMFHFMLFIRSVQYIF